eukprot:NODE_1783_length_1811_cov_58.917654_g1513_i0.p1 GENE.NODE_1783_length_1811_cov_58.917654_g1513_i0~~NODE_1783_length_1811_cov_58.917654_g1513_i0.p1  ORF type:complete len:542 (-),score=134.36 NODE_1783_length_1811_cov_58.917654_g1513_i0:95-1720(-)
MLLRRPINIAPDVSVPDTDYPLLDLSAQDIAYNPPANQLFAPILGPSNPWKPEGYGMLNTLAGYYERHHLHEHAFKEQFHLNNTEGCPEDAEHDREVKRKRAMKMKLKAEKKKQPKENKPEGDNEEDKEVVEDEDDEDDNEDSDDEIRKKKKKDQSHLDPDRMALVAKRAGNVIELPGDETKEGLTVYYEEDERSGKRLARYEAIEPKSVLHIQEAHDYQGRSFLYDPLKDSDRPSYLPKKILHTYRGHNRGVQCIRWFPPHGHLILSAGLDGKVKIWDVMNSRNVIRTYSGHSKAIKDVTFTNNGEQFISAGWDRFLRVWDTETGKVLTTVTTGSQPNCVKYHPDDDKQSIFLVGMGDKKIIQWDLRTTQITQVYDQHMAAVNSLIFIDNNKKFVTTGDDKTVRVWEWDIPFVTKYVADPAMQSMPTGTMSPNGKWVAYQSMDNRIRIFIATDRFRSNQKKVFRGHVASGYACQVGWSPDCRYICTGDGDGFLWFWEWKTQRVVKRIKAHDGVCIGVLWHPVDPSRVATCSWDSTIKVWD